MEHNKPKAKESNSNAKDDLKSLPMPERQHNIKNAAGSKCVNDVTLFINNVTLVLFHVFNLIPVKTL